MDVQSDEEPPVENDLVIQIGDKNFLANRKVFIEKLRFFRRKISTEMLKEKQTVFVLEPENVDPETFNDVIRYICALQIEFSTSNIESIYKTADYLQYDALLDEAEKVMKNANKTKPKIFVRLMDLAAKYNLISIQRECVQSFISNPPSGPARKYIVSKLSFENLKNILKRMNDRKEDMFNLCVEWIEGDSMNRSEKNLELLKLIQTAFQKEKESIPSMVPNSCLPHSNIQPRNVTPKSLYAIGGYNGKVLSSVSKLDPSTNIWTESTELPYPLADFGCTVFDRKIYICGGFNGRKNLYEFIVYDTDTDQWTKLERMADPRKGNSMTVLDGYLYVAGGHSYHVLSSSSLVQRYSVENNYYDKWQLVKNMNTSRDGLELVTLNGFLYAIGGLNKKRLLNSVERYSPQTDKWKEVASLNNGYAWFGSTVLNNRIYVTNGFNCEVYYPEDDKWHIMPAPNECKGALRLIVFENQLLAIGGLFLRNVIERFDFQKNAWFQESEIYMDIGRGHHRLALV